LPELSKFVFCIFLFKWCIIVNEDRIASLFYLARSAFKITATSNTYPHTPTYNKQNKGDECKHMPTVTVAMFSDRIQTEKDRLAEAVT
jgi:hypothetical protein